MELAQGRCSRTQHTATVTVDRQNVRVALIIDGVLSEASLIAAAGQRVFDRGQDAVRDVSGLRLERGYAEASVQARRVHVASLDWSDGTLTGACSCTSSRDAGWCGHMVAVGLAALDSVTPPPAGDGDSPVDTYLTSLSTEALGDLVRVLAATSPEASRLLETPAAEATGDTSAVGQQLLDAMRAATAPRGFIDYRRTFGIATEVQGLLDELEQLLDHGGNGAAGAAAPALLKALTATRRITEHADDSSGVVGDACQRAADLYARACREGTVDGVKLARWLLKFRESSPGWPETPLENFAPALGDKGLAIYRTRVAELDRDASGLGHVDRFRVDQMLLELADHDGDVDAAVALLTRDAEHTQFGAIVTRLMAAGREGEALRQTDRAVAAGRIGMLGQGNDFWLSPEDVANRYAAHGRPDDALAVLRRAFARQPGRAAYEVLSRVADRLGVGNVERTWAVEEAKRIARRPHMTGQALVEIALGDDDVERAWAAADDFGAGNAWRRLAEASKESMPMRAVGLHLEALAPKLERADRGAYADVAAQLREMREYYKRGGAVADFEVLVRSLRDTYRRRPSFIATLDKARLPR